MNNSQPPLSTRREFLKTSGQIAAVSALAGVSIPFVHAASSETINIALVGCGGRGTGAAKNAMDQTGPPINLVAMADIFQHRLQGSHDSLKRNLATQVKVPEDQKFIGFDGYKKAIDCLKKGDVAIFTTPMAFRAAHFAYAVEKGVNIFMEKPVTADGPKSRLMLKLNEEALKKGLKVGVGLNSRHSRALQELHKRVQDGEIGDIMLMRGYRMSAADRLGILGKISRPRQQPARQADGIAVAAFAFPQLHLGERRLLQRLLHPPHRSPELDEKRLAREGAGARRTPLPRQLRGSEFRQLRGRIHLRGRRETLHGWPLHDRRAPASTPATCTAQRAWPSPRRAGTPGCLRARTRDRLPSKSNQIWQSDVAKHEMESHFNEWTDLIDAIRSDKPFNEVKYGVEASVVTSMGRMAAHTGQEVTFDEMLNHEHEYCPDADKLTMDSPPPLLSDKDGKYPVPTPGLKKGKVWQEWYV